MPESGGAYYCVSRAIGLSFSMFVGIGQWFGLVFSSAFYLVGFGRYATDLLSQFEINPGDPEVLFATGKACFARDGIFIVYQKG